MQGYPGYAGDVGGGLEAYFRSIPPVTRAIGTATFGVTVAAALGLLSPSYIMMLWPLVIKKLHLWRIVTDYLFIGKFGFGWLFHMYFFLQYSSRLESHPSFNPRLVGHGAYLYFIFIQMVLLHVIGLVFNYPIGKPFMAGALMFSIIYYWSKKEPYVPTVLWGFQVNGWQLPYALLVLDVLMGASIWQDVMGLASAHFYHFLRDVLPVEKNIAPLKNTPQIFSWLTNSIDFFNSTPPQRSGSQSGNTPQQGRTTGDTPGASNGNNFRTLFGGRGATTGTTNNHEFPGRGHRAG